MSDLNQSAIRKHALTCSVKLKGGRFTRVGQAFIDEVEADVECMVRRLRAEHAFIGSDVSTVETFTTGALGDKLKEAINGAIARLIQNKVQRQPSVGCTLGRTR